MAATEIRIRGAAEHDRETITHADWVVNLGPGAGEHGGVATTHVPALRHIHVEVYLANLKFPGGKEKIRRHLNEIAESRVQGSAYTSMVPRRS